jgi:hypothetical protein
MPATAGYHTKYATWSKPNILAALKESCDQPVDHGTLRATIHDWTNKAPLRDRPHLVRSDQRRLWSRVRAVAERCGNHVVRCRYAQAMYAQVDRVES